MQTTGPGASGTERKRVEAVVQTLAASQSRGETLAEVAHEARNMVAALGLYCDLLEEPGVLAQSFVHYGEELRLVAAASRRLVEKLVALDVILDQPPAAVPGRFWRSEGAAAERWPARLAAESRIDPPAAQPVSNLAAELLATRNLLAALAGPGIVVSVDAQGGARGARITAEDLTRVLVNLVKNAVEAMPSGGRILISLCERSGGDGQWLILTVADNGPGFADEALDRVFESGYTGHKRADGRLATHRGLGLAITRAIVEAAGGHISAANRSQGGAELVLELPAE